MSDITNSPGAGTPQRIIPAFSGIYDALRPYCYPLVRITCGALLIPHGIAKLFGDAAPGTAFFMALKLGGATKEMAGEAAAGWMPVTYYLGTLELVGGVMLTIGLLTRIIAAQVLVFMIVAGTMVHAGFGFFWNKAGWEMPLMWGLLALVVLIRGGGQYSVDNMIGKEF